MSLRTARKRGPRAISGSPLRLTGSPHLASVRAKRADAALMRQLGAEGVFVGSGIFKSGDPAKRAAAIVRATTFFDDPKVIADASRNLGEAMVGINIDTLPESEHYANRGW